jgi:hypothetical protein
MLSDGAGLAVLEAVRRKELPVKVAVMSAAEQGSVYWTEAMRFKPDASSPNRSTCLDYNSG